MSKTVLKVKTGILLLIVIMFSFTACAKDENMESNGNMDQANIENSGIESSGSSYSLSKEATDFSEEAKLALVSEGNNQRATKILEKIKKQEELAIAYFGGSITEGYQVSKKQSYAAQTTSLLKDLLQYENISTIYGGLSGTSSTIGLLRVGEDVLNKNPDIIVLEFAVNDGKDALSQMAFDSLVKQCLMQENEPLVILLFTVLENGYTCEKEMTVIGETYELPMISVDNLLKAKYESGNFSWDDYAMDEAHPKYQGHKLIAEALEYCFFHIFQNIGNEQIDERIDYETVNALGEVFYPTKFYNSMNFEPEELGGFEIGSSNIEHFPNGWIWEKDGNKSDGMEFNFTGKNLFLLYKEEHNEKVGNMEIYVDGVYTKTVYGNSEAGWNNPQVILLLNEVNEETHHIKIVPEAGSEEKIFHILGFGTSGILEGSFEPVTMEDLANIPYQQRAIIREGNLDSIANFYKKLESKESVTIGFIGGSITQGSGASSYKKCYVSKVADWFQEQYPEQEFHIVNGGIGATTSQFACARVEEDLLVYQPDLVVVEFSVNDENNQIYRETYESLIRNILLQENQPAVITLNMVQYDNGVSAQGIHGEVADYYDLPQISMKDSIYKEIKLGNLKSTDVSEDMIHPNDKGHAYAAELITYYLSQTQKQIQENQKDNLQDELNSESVTIEPIKEASMELISMNSVRYYNLNSKPDLAGFETDTSEQTSITDVFKNGWKAKEEGSSIVFQVKGTHFTLCYRKTNTMTAPQGIAIIDGDEDQAIPLDGNFTNGWGNWLYLHDLPVQEEGTHTIEIRLTTTGSSDFYLASLIGK